MLLLNSGWYDGKASHKWQEQSWPRIARETIDEVWKNSVGERELNLTGVKTKIILRIGTCRDGEVWYYGVQGTDRRCEFM